jgi:hypothetical protein
MTSGGLQVRCGASGFRRNLAGLLEDIQGKERPGEFREDDPKNHHREKEVGGPDSIQFGRSVGENG